MNAPTGTPRHDDQTGAVRSPGPTSAIPTARAGEHPFPVHTDAMRPVPQPAPHQPVAPSAPSAPRTVRVRTASIIATVTFLLGLGVSMLIGPLGGPPSGGPGGAGGSGGDPGTSQSTQQGTQQGAGT